MSTPDLARARYQHALSLRNVGSPWARILTGPERGWSFRDAGGTRYKARGEAAKIVIDQLLRAQGCRLVELRGGCVIEKDADGPQAAPARAA